MAYDNWAHAVDTARDLAEAAEKSDQPEKHVRALAKAVKDLCDAIELLAEKKRD